MKSIYIKLSELLEAYEQLNEPRSYKLTNGDIVWVKPMHVVMSVPREYGGELHLVTGKVLHYTS